MHDLLIVGGGPAGAIAGLVAARAGAHVRIVDRATFPRDKLCGDTINPGALRALVRLGVGEDVAARGLRVDGMLVTGDRGAAVAGRYPPGLHGRAMLRRELDALLLRAAVAAGCEFEEGVVVRRAAVETARHTPLVRGVVVATRQGEATLSAPVIIAADGRRSTVAFGLGLSGHPQRPRRWAIGAYFTGVTPRGQIGRLPELDPVTATAVMGEMHVRRDGYIGVAPLPDGLTNVCLVRQAAAGDPEFRDPAAMLRRTIANDPILRDRLAGGTFAARPVVLGPLAIDRTGLDLNGLLLAGDAAGFVDPMTGDGLRFAIHGGELAALAALRALEHGWDGVHDSLSGQRIRAFAPKWRFNRALRALVGSPRALAAAALGARVAPAALRAVIARAGDCDLAA